MWRLSTVIAPQVYVHEWSPRDFVIWDNRSTLHSTTVTWRTGGPNGVSDWVKIEWSWTTTSMGDSLEESWHIMSTSIDLIDINWSLDTPWRHCGHDMTVMGHLRGCPLGSNMAGGEVAILNGHLRGGIVKLDGGVFQQATFDYQRGNMMRKQWENWGALLILFSVRYELEDDRKQLSQ